jgi:hypothetical protein
MLQQIVRTKIVVMFLGLAKLQILLKIRGFWILLTAFACVGTKYSLTRTKIVMKVLLCQLIKWNVKLWE